MPGLGGGRPAQPREDERGHGHPDEAEHERPRLAAEQDDAGRGRDHDRGRHGPPAGARVPGRAPEVPRDGAGPAEPLAAAADAHVEPVGEHEVGEPERCAENEHRASCEHRLPKPVTSHRQDVCALAAQEEHAVGVGRDGEQCGEHPERPPRPPPALEGREQCQRAGEGAEQEQAVHPTVDPVEEEQPARREDRRRHERDRRARETPPEQRDERQARQRERRGRESQAAQPEPEMGDGPCDEEVERRAATVASDVLDDARERVAADEERERLVLVRGPRHQLMEKEGGRDDRHPRDPEPQPARDDPGAGGRACGRRGRRLDPCLDPLRHGVSATFAGRLAVRCRSTNTVVRTGTRSRCSSE